jgi:hypothetical protein
MSAQEINYTLERMGFLLESSPPIPGVDVYGKREWPHIRYNCDLKLNGQVVWSGPYSLGIGHVDLKRSPGSGPRDPG